MTGCCAVGLQPPKGGGTAAFADVHRRHRAGDRRLWWCREVPGCGWRCPWQGESSAAGGSRKDGAAEEMAEESDSGCTGDEALEDAERPDEYVDFCAEEAPEMVRS